MQSRKAKLAGTPKQSACQKETLEEVTNAQIESNLINTVIKTTNTRKKKMLKWLNIISEHILKPFLVGLVSTYILLNLIIDPSRDEID